MVPFSCSKLANSSANFSNQYNVLFLLSDGTLRPQKKFSRESHARSSCSLSSRILAFFFNYHPHHAGYTPQIHCHPVKAKSLITITNTYTTRSKNHLLRPSWTNIISAIGQFDLLSPSVHDAPFWKTWAIGCLADPVLVLIFCEQWSTKNFYWRLHTCIPNSFNGIKMIYI